jgi:alanine dehydrogenase
VVRRLKSLKVFSPTKENREKFAADVTRQLELSAKAVDNPESVTKDVDIVIVCTDTIERFFSAPGLP